MTFDFEGQQYLIAFMHAKSRDWAAHELHEISLAREAGKLVLCCETCKLQLSSVPKRDRARFTKCTIFRVWRDPDNERRDRSRSIVAEGIGRCNPLDTWTREGGSIAALRNALADDLGGNFQPIESKRFRAAAWKAYETRATAARRTGGRV